MLQSQLKLSLKSSDSAGGGRAQLWSPEPDSTSIRQVVPALPLAGPRLGPGDSRPLGERAGVGSLLGDLRKAEWLRRKGPALASPHSFYGSRPTTLLSLSSPGFLLL